MIVVDPNLLSVSERALLVEGESARLAPLVPSAPGADRLKSAVGGFRQAWSAATKRDGADLVEFSARIAAVTREFAELEQRNVQTFQRLYDGVNAVVPRTPTGPLAPR